MENFNVSVIMLVVWIVVLQICVIISVVGFFFFKAKIDKMFDGYQNHIADQLSKWNIRIQSVEKTTSKLNETASKLFQSITNNDGEE